ncbi:MAG: GGDEF domain-containing protein [Geminicoccaceae bacterium]|nr:GGDEF domain-containing protein [Geminicoccaceae bacterium]
MKIRDEELLARLRALSSRVRRAGRRRLDPKEAVDLLGLGGEELTPKVQGALSELIAELVDVRQTLEATQHRLGELERLADEDALAPVYNRRAFLRHLGRTISYIDRYGVPSSLLYFDLDGLKAINDEFGHAAGDQALIHVANTLTSKTRLSDLVGRLGGDEFGVILARADQRTAEIKARRLAEAIKASPLVMDGQSIQVSVAHGARELVPDEDATTALAEADRAMYARKRAR